MTPAPLLLVGAGGFARETLELIGAINALTPRWRVAGVLDDDPAKHGQQVHDVEVLGPSELAHDLPNAQVVLCVASPSDPLRRVRMAQRLGLAPERLATLVHPSAVVPRSAVIGPGTVLHANVVLTADVRLGAHVAVMPATVLTHDDVVGEGVTFGAGARVAGGVTIEDGAYIGAGALIREHLRIGRGALIGMGAALVSSVGDGEVWAGVPARRIRSSIAMPVAS